MTEPEKLLVKLTRATDALRWFVWMDHHQADVLTIDGKVSVSVTLNGRFQMESGKTLSEAMAAMEKKLSEAAREARRWRAFNATVKADS